MKNRIRQACCLAISNLISSATARDSSYMLIGNLVTTLMGYLLIVILTRNLPTSSFGLIITALAFTQLATDVIELGINSATTNFISSSKKEEKFRYLKAILTLKTCIALGGAIIIFSLSPMIAELIFKSEAITPYIQISAIGVFLLTIIASGVVIFQAEKKFLLASILSTGINVTRLGIVFILLVFGLFNEITAYFVFQSILVILVLTIFLKIGFGVFKVRSERDQYRKIFKFGLPVGGGIALAAVYSRLDQILIFNIAGDVEAGIYGLAFRVASVLIFASAALGAAISPRFASIAGQDFIKYFKKTLLASSGLVLVGILSIPLAPILLPLIFGAKFSGSVIPYQILTLGMTFFVITSPFNAAILYRYKKTKFNFFSGILVLVMIWIMLTLLIPRYQSSGAAMAVTFVYALQMVLTAGYFLLLNNRLVKNKTQPDKVNAVI